MNESAKQFSSSTPALAESKFPISISYQLADGTSTTPRGAVPRSL
jgi:hypothetical protein